MKVLVTGATGFIGNYVINELLKSNDIEIIATSIENKNVLKNEWLDEVKYIQCNLNNYNENFFLLFEKPELLMHLAWEGLPNYKELFHYERNLFTYYKFIKVMIKNGLRSLSVIGTCQEYGMINGSLSENLNVNPNTPYGLAKDTLRRFIKVLNKTYEFDFKWIRLFYVYGKGQNPNSLMCQLERALENNEEIFNMSGGEQLRDYLHVKKVAEYIVKISLQNEINGIINCCSGKPISVRRLVENHLREREKTIKLNLGYFPYSEYEPMAFWGDNTKLLRVLKEKVSNSKLL